jgi:hypothetical protein
MAVFSTQAYKDTAELITLYNRAPGEQARYNQYFKTPNYYFRGRTKLKTILYIVEAFKHAYRSEVKEALGEKDKTDFSEDVGDIFKNFYIKGYLNQFKARMGPTLDKSPLLPESDKFLEDTSKLTQQNQDNALEEKTNQLRKERQEQEREQEKEKEKERPRGRAPIQVIEQVLKEQPTPEFIRNLGSKAQIEFRENLLVRAPRFIRSFLGGEEVPTPSKPPTYATQIGERMASNTSSAVGRRVASGIGRSLAGGGREGALRAGSGLARAGGGLVARGGVLLFTTPVGWVILAIIGLFILVFILMRLHLLDNTALLPPYEQQTSNDSTLNQAGPDQGISISKSGPDSISNNTSFTYELDVTYTGKGQANLQVTDSLPNQLSFSSCTDNCTQSGNSIIWQLSQVPQNQTKKIFVSVNPTDSDFYTVNSAEAVITSVLGGTSLGVGQSSDFLSLMRTQGRNVNIIADNPDDFANRIINNAQSTNLTNLVNQSDRLKQIFQVASAANVNPLAVVAIWGVEAGFDINDTEFGCQPFSSGFGTQLTCSVNTLDYWMNFFDQNNTNGSYQLTPNCNYTDSFVFAYDKYTPVCAINDGNDTARTNFIKFYTSLGRGIQ